MVKNKLKNLVVPEVSTEPGLREMETGNYKELAEDEETFIDELGVEKTSDEIDDLVGEKVKLEDEDSVMKSMTRSWLKTKKPLLMNLDWSRPVTRLSI